MTSKRNPAWRLEVTHFNAVGDAVVLVMFTTSVSGTLFASANDQEKKSDLWIPKELRLHERPSHRLQQVFGVRPQRFPPGLRPSCPVLCLRGAGHCLVCPWAAVLGRDGVSGNLLFTDDEPETDTSGTFRTRAQSGQSGGWKAADSLQRGKREAFETVFTPAGWSTTFTFVICGNWPLLIVHRVLTWRRTCRVKQLCRTEAPDGREIIPGKHIKEIQALLYHQSSRSLVTIHFEIRFVFNLPLHVSPV